MKLAIMCCYRPRGFEQVPNFAKDSAMKTRKHRRDASHQQWCLWPRMYREVNRSAASSLSFEPLECRRLFTVDPFPLAPLAPLGEMISGGIVDVSATGTSSVSYTVDVKAGEKVSVDALFSA